MAGRKPSVVLSAATRAALDAALGNHEARIRTLERQTPPAATPGLEWMHANGVDLTVTTSGTKYPSLDDPAGVVTNAPDLYTTDLGVGTSYGFTVAENGVYLVQWTIYLSQATAGHRFTGYYTGDIGIRSGWLYGNTEVYYDGTIDMGRRMSWSELMFVGGDYGSESLPSGPETASIIDHDAGNYHAIANVYVRRLSTIYQIGVGT